MRFPAIKSQTYRYQHQPHPRDARRLRSSDHYRSGLFVTAIGEILIISVIAFIISVSANIISVTFSLISAVIIVVIHTITIIVHVTSVIIHVITDIILIGDNVTIVYKRLDISHALIVCPLNGSGEGR